MVRAIQWVILYAFSPLWYALSHRVNGHSFQDFIEFLKGR